MDIDLKKNVFSVIYPILPTDVMHDLQESFLYYNLPQEEHIILLYSQESKS